MLSEFGAHLQKEHRKFYQHQYQYRLFYCFMNGEDHSPQKLTGCETLLPLPKLT